MKKNNTPHSHTQGRGYTLVGEGSFSSFCILEKKVESFERERKREKGEKCKFLLLLLSMRVLLLFFFFNLLFFIFSSPYDDVDEGDKGYMFGFEVLM